MPLGELFVSDANSSQPDTTKYIEILVKNSEQLSTSATWNTAYVNVTFTQCFCDSMLCLNGGTCETDANQKFNCACPQGNHLHGIHLLLLRF